MKKYGIAVGIIVILVIAAVISVAMEILEFFAGVTLAGVLVLVLIVLFIKWKTRG